MSNNIGSNFITFSAVKDLLLEGKVVKIKVQGQSMLPFFRSGSAVNIRPIKDNDFKPLAVVFAEVGNRFVIHRIISLSNTSVTLLGDGNIKGTETTTKDKVYGTVDCSGLHLLFARFWLFMKPLRRYPLAVFRKLM